MGFRTFRRIRVLAVSLTTVTATTTLFAMAGAAGSASAASSNGCPASKTLASLKTANNLTAGFSTDSSDVTTYTFASAVAETPVGPGVPGLMKYCVYPTNPVAQPTTTTVLAHGAGGSLWNEGAGSNNFAFVRPGGDKTNIELDGTSTTMGTATWSTVPADQTIILHINDPTVCHDLYGGTSLTCFVKPGGPICNLGDTSVAYNAMPFGVENCLNPAIGFEATGTNEFGDAVGLKTGTGRTLNSLIVDFQSYACQSGHWNTGDCSSTAGATFHVPGGITAKIYETDSTGTAIGNELATATIDPAIPYRPSASGATICPSTGTPPQWTAGSMWFNPLAPNGGSCQTSIADKLVFEFSGSISLPDNVIWTVQFNTSTAGYSPIGPASCQADPGGCPYDSLNVGGKTYPNAPYAGTDIDVDQAIISQGGTNAPLQVQAGWSDFRPLGEIITTP